MERSELDIIKELMAELESKMEPDHNDFSERLGRDKPDVKMVKIEGELPESPEMEKKEEMMGMSDDQDMGEMGKDPMADKMMGSDEDMPMDEMDPDAKLKARLMRLRS